MDIRKIIREEVDDFDWIKDIEPRYLKVNDLEVGKTYKYLADLDAYNAVGDNAELPSWLEDYHGNELTINSITNRSKDGIDTIGVDYDPNYFTYDGDYEIYFTWGSDDLGVETSMGAGTNFFRWAKFQPL